MRRRSGAWAGLVIFVAHALFKAWLKYAINAWYGRFYDVLQTTVSNTTSQHFLEHRRSDVSQLLVSFVLMVSPAVVVHPIAKWVSSVWRYSWRIALVKAYLIHYNVQSPAIEGAAQRIHEDTQRFEVGIYGCFATVLDSVLTLVVFVPVLLDVGSQAMPPGVDSPAWLVGIATASAFGGLLVSMFVGRRLVGLEVANQRVEAKLRTKLVVLEQTPALIVGAERASHPTVLEPETFARVHQHVPRPRPLAPGFAFRAVLCDLTKNYKRLFLNFAGFNLWISMYDQAMTILPYVLVAPLMFADDPTRRISLGTLMKCTNSFGKVFDAMAVVTENWTAINDFRATVRRLGEFERSIYGGRYNHVLLSDEHEVATMELADIDDIAEAATKAVRNGDCTHTESGTLDDRDEIAT